MTYGAVYALDVAFDVRLLSPKDLISVVSQLYSNDGQLGSSPYSQGEAGRGHASQFGLRKRYIN